MLSHRVRQAGGLASGRRALDIVWGISQHHRIQGSPGLDEAIDYARGLLEEAGLEVRVYEYPADGRAEFWGWPTPVGWEVKDAEIWLWQPEKKKIADFSSHPTVVAAHSAPTDGWEEADLVDVGSGLRKSEYDRPVVGKIVMASGRASVVHRMAVIERMARGTLSYSTRSPPDCFPYVGIWPTADEVEKVGVALTVSRKWADRLQSLLRKGERVVLRFRVESEFREGKLRVLEARLPGEQDRDLLLIAHICHPRPGAHDNASGSAAVLEAARVLAEMASSGLKLIRGVRVWLVPEFTGTLAHLSSHPELAESLVGVLNLDMVGSDLHVTGGTLSVVGFPLYAPSFMPLLAHRALEVALSTREYFEGHRVVWTPFTLNPYSDGSDHHVFADPKVGVPQTAYGEWPDAFYHTDCDVPENLDPRLLAAVASAAAGLMAELASADGEELHKLAKLTALLARRHGSREFAELAESEGAQDQARTALIPQAYFKAVASLTRISPEEEFSQFVKSLSSRVLIDMTDLKRELGASASPLNVASDERFRRIGSGPFRLMSLFGRIQAERFVEYVENPKLYRAAYHLLYALSLREDLEGACELVMAEVDVGWDELKSVARDLEMGGLIKRIKPGG